MRNDPNPDYSTMSNEQLCHLIQERLGDTEATFKTVCCLLNELRQRSFNHPLMGHPLYRKFDKVASGVLTPKAVLGFAGYPTALELIQNVDTEMQDRLAAGEKVPVVSKDTAGRYVFEQKPVLQMDASTLKRVFGPDGIRSREDQEHMLAAELKQPVKVKVTASIAVIPKKEKIQVGKTTISLDDMREPLRLLGYKLVKINSRTDAA